MNGQGFGRALTIALILVAAGIATAAEDVNLDFFDWQVGAMGSVMEGRAVLIVLPDGTWRASVGSASEIESLTSEFGEGWPLIGLGSGEVWWNEWRGPSQQLHGRRAPLLERIVSTLVSENQLEPWSFVLDQPVGWEPTISVDPAGGPGHLEIASRLACRASGRGDPEETLWCRTISTPSGSKILIRSRRRPGSLTLLIWESRPVQVDLYEILVPAWPIDDLLTGSIIH